MYSLLIFCISLGAAMHMTSSAPKTATELIDTVVTNCEQMQCVKQNVLRYLNNILHMERSQKSIKNIDNVVFKRVAKILKTNEFKMSFPDQTDVTYSAKRGFDVKFPTNEGRDILKKKLMLPFLLLLKLKLKALMPIFVALIGLKALKALILSKLSIAIVLGFVIFQLMNKSGMPMPMMSMAPVESPVPIYGAPVVSSSPPSSYEPGWEPSQSGPYSRVWVEPKHEPHNIAYSAYYPGTQSPITSHQ